MDGHTDIQTDRQRDGGLTVYRVDVIVSSFHWSINKMFLISLFVAHG